jgi:hypothetical protein
MTPNRLTFITVAFNDDIELNLLQLQAFSFCMVADEIIDAIYVVLEGLSPNEIHLKDYANRVKSSYPHNLRNRVFVLSGFELVIGSDSYNFKQGWYNQQALKLLAACKANTRYSIILDAKNHFIKPIELSSFFDSELPCYFIQRQAPKMRRFWEGSLAFFDAIDPFPNSDF